MRLVLTVASVAVFAMVSPAGDASPAGVRVSPVVLHIPSMRPTSSLRLENGRAAPASFQVDAYAWTQFDGVDVLTPTRSLAAAPSVFELPPGNGRLIRVALGPASHRQARERAYRLVVRELPAAVVSAGHARVLLELSILVFEAPAGAAPRLTARRSGSSIVLSNEGSAHLRLHDVTPGGRSQRDLPRYLLAGASVRLRPSQTADTLRVSFLPAGATVPTEQVIAVAPDPQLVAARQP